MIINAILITIKTRCTKTAALLLFIGFAWLISSHFIWQCVKTIHTYQTFKKSAHHQIVTLSITQYEADFQKIKKQLLSSEHEIKLQNQMFDVKHFSIAQNKITIYGWFDKKDDALNKILHQLFNIKKRSDQNSKCYSQIWSFEGIIDDNIQNAERILIFSKITFSHFIKNKLLSQKIEYLSPPPEV